MVASIPREVKSPRTRIAVLQALVSELREYIATTDSNYARNYAQGLRTYPIPFFGDLGSARVVTVGLNPSSTEFEGRAWPSVLDARALTERLIRYFARDAHPWFKPWEAALELIGASYRHDAAHIDISPRATVSARAVPDRALFERMLVADLPWLVRILDAAPEARLLLVAGTATKRLYLNEFLAKHLPSGRARFEGPLTRPPGPGKVLHHTLILGPRRLPVYFCSSSPSDRTNPGLLIERVRRDAPLLCQWLAR